MQPFQNIAKRPLLYFVLCFSFSGFVSLIEAVFEYDLNTIQHMLCAFMLGITLDLLVFPFIDHIKKSRDLKPLPYCKPQFKEKTIRKSP